MSPPPSARPRPLASPASPWLHLLGRLHSSWIHGRRSERVAVEMAAAVGEAPGAVVVDVGCGDGRVGAAVALKLGARASGFEVRTRPSHALPVALFDGARLPLADRAVDYVLLADVVHHLEDPAPLLREAGRVAQRAVVVKDHCADTPWARLALRVMDWGGNAPHGIAAPGRYLSSADWSRLAAAAGLRIVALRAIRGLYPRYLDGVCGRDFHVVLTLAADGR